MSNLDRVKDMLRRMNDESDRTAITDYIDPSYVEHESLPPGMPPTIDGVYMLFDAFHQVFADMRTEIIVALEDGNLVTVHTHIAARHVGEFMGFQPTYEIVVGHVIDIFRFNEDGKIIEHWGITDYSSLHQQIQAAAERQAAAG
jgi:predicted SnoaL-like aldol condensation-catalyzing enzyme